MTSQVLFTSDLHLGHSLAAEKRGFCHTDNHDETVIKTLKDQCTKRTVLWILGDVCMKVDKMPMLAEIPGRKILVRGNHDKFDDGVYRKYFERIEGFLRYKKMWISHCPIHPGEMYRVKLNVHGHIHRKFAPDAPMASKPLNFPYFNVNWDYWQRALNLDELKAVRDCQ